MSPNRLRCASCGNLTRFDVVTERRVRAFHHFSVGGDLTVEDEEVLTERVVETTCRWCGHGRSIEIIDEADPAAAPGTAATPDANATATADATGEAGAPNA